MNTSLASADAANASDTTPITYLAQQPIASSEAVNDGNWRQGPRTLRDAIARVLRSIRSFGPYVAIELILPGGSIIALALWTYRHRRAARGSGNTVSSAIVASIRCPQVPSVTPCTQR